MAFRIETAARGRFTVFTLSGRIEKQAVAELNKLFSGTRLTQIEKATLEQKATLDTFASPDGTKILVRFTADSTTTAGKKTLVFMGHDGHTAEVLVEVA